MKELEISKKFSNKENMYYGHGTGANNNQVIESIFKNGLRCSHERLYFTTIALGEGSDELFEKNKEMLNNWEHNESKYIIIASLPKDYHLIGPVGTSLYGKEHDAFYNYLSKEEANKLGIAPGYYLKPEFVSGVYDANAKEFVSNEKYYENLPIEEQEKLFEEIKKQYVELLRSGPWTLKEYSEILEQMDGVKNPLTPEEIEKFDKEVFDAKKLEEDLQDIAEAAKQSDFNKTTNEIKEDEKQSEKDEEKTYEDEGWEVDDWE